MAIEEIEVPQYDGAFHAGDLNPSAVGGLIMINPSDLWLIVSIRKKTQLYTGLEPLFYGQKKWVSGVITLIILLLGVIIPIF